MGQADKAWLVFRIVLGGLVAAIAWHGFAGLVLGAGYPANTFLFKPEIVFSDFGDIFRPVQQGSPLGSELAVYFPFAYVTLLPFIGMGQTTALIAVSLLFTGGLLAFFWHKLSALPRHRRALVSATLALGTYPVIFCIDRGNMEMMVFLFVLGFLALFERKHYILAAVALACATAMKLYPGALGMLLLKRRRWGAAAATAGLTGAITIGSAAAFTGGVHGTFILLGRNLAHFRQNYYYNEDTIAFSSGYFSALKVIGRLFGASVETWAQASLMPYQLLAFGLLLALSLYVVLIERTLWKQVALPAFAMILLPPISFDYKLIHALVPLGLFLRAAPGDVADDRIYALLFGLLLVPKAYLPYGAEATIGVLLNPLCMTLIGSRIVAQGLRRRRRAGPADGSAIGVAGCEPLPRRDLHG